PVQAVAAILYRDEQVFCPEGEVVEGRVLEVAQEEQRQRPGVVGRPALRDLEQPAEASEGGPSGGVRVRVPRLREVELAEVSARTEHAVLGALERRALALGRRVGVEGRRRAADGGVVDRDPVRVEDQSVRVEGAGGLRKGITGR